MSKSTNLQPAYNLRSEIMRITTSQPANNESLVPVDKNISQGAQRSGHSEVTASSPTFEPPLMPRKKSQKSLNQENVAESSPPARRQLAELPKTAGTSGSHTPVVLAEVRPAPAASPSKAMLEKAELINASPAVFFSTIFDKLIKAWDVDGTDESQGVSKNDLLQSFSDIFKDKAAAYAKAWKPGDNSMQEAPIAVLKRLLPYITSDQAVKIDGDLQALCDEVPAYARPVPARAYCIWEGNRIGDKHLSNLATFLKLNEDHSLTVLTSNPGLIHAALARREDGNWLAKRLIVQKPNYSDEPILGSGIQRENNGPYANYASGSDMGRVHALAETGGIYFDVDCEFKKKLPLLRAPLGILVTNSNNYFFNGLLAAPENSEALRGAVLKMRNLYDDRHLSPGETRAPWLEETWVSKRANVPLALGQTDDRSIEAQIRSSMENIEDVEANLPTLQYYREQLERLKTSPRQTITEETTVDSLLTAISDSLDTSGNYQRMHRSVNVFGAMKESGDIELPMTNEWKDTSRRPRRASL
ncbi:glycosyltransferase [Paraburkholderia aspalathi]|uniref:glycosyltransferase n=1 Tax=Paraburkholderia aspalathi TaxID=1324617 RepID=UPI0038B99874